MYRKGLIVLILIAGLVHLSTLSMDNAGVHWVFKLLPMILMIVLAASSAPVDRTRVYQGLVVVGLAFSLAGDAFLLNAGDRWFMLGLASFMVGHLFYVAAMLMRWRFSLLRLLFIVPMGAYAWFVGSRLHESIIASESQKELWVPVLIYLSVISIMCWLAVMSRNGHAAMGAILFVASDSILAWNKFVGDVPASGFWVMLTYFAAQLLITGSVANVFARQSRKKPADRGASI